MSIDADTINSHLAHFATHSDVTLYPHAWEEFVRDVREVLAENARLKAQHDLTESQIRLPAGVPRSWTETAEENVMLRKLCEAEGSGRERANVRIAALEKLLTQAKSALEYYNGAPWVGESRQWCHSNLAKRAEHALNDIDDALSGAGKWGQEDLPQMVNQQ